MTMHLEGPWLSTTGKKKGKVKYKSSNHAQTAKKLAEEWAQKELEWKKMSPLYGKSTKNVSAPSAQSTTVSQDRNPKSYGKSLNQWITGPVASKPTQKYTGENNMAIVVQHKSCLQPVFNQEAMIDSAKMRR